MSGRYLQQHNNLKVNIHKQCSIRLCGQQNNCILIFSVTLIVILNITPNYYNKHAIYCGGLIVCVFKITLDLTACLKIKKEFIQYNLFHLFVVSATKILNVNNQHRLIFLHSNGSAISVKKYIRSKLLSGEGRYFLWSQTQSTKPNCLNLVIQNVSQSKQGALINLLSNTCSKRTNILKCTEIIISIKGKTI